MAKSLSQTPAPAKDRIKGSKVNSKGSASSEKTATEIKFDAKTIVALNNKLKEFREKHDNENITLNDLKAVYRRGLGAYSTSHRPNITRGGWAMARVNKFLLKAGGTKVKKAYVQDDDLMKYAKGGEIDKLINDGVVELKMFSTTNEHSKIYGFDAKNPLYVQSLIVSKSNRMKGIGTKVMQYIIEYADKNGHDLIFGHITQKAEPNIDVIKSMLQKSGFNTIDGNNDFYKLMNVTDMKYADGGEVGLFYKWYIDWYKGIKNDITIIIALPNELRPFKEDNVVIFDKFEKSNKSVKAYKYLQQIVDKADEYRVTIYLEPTPIGNTKTRNELIEYYQSFGFELTPNKEFMKRLPKYADSSEVGQDIKCRRCRHEWNTKKSEAFDKYVCHICMFDNRMYYDVDPIGYADGGEVDEHNETYAKWKSIVNMSYGELKRFYDSKEGKEAGLSTSEANKQGISSGRESARMIMKMKTTPKDKWTDTMWKWANKQISFISRMSGMQGELYDDKGNKTRKHTSLLIWGHNPKKSSIMKYDNGGATKGFKYSKTFSGITIYTNVEQTYVGNNYSPFEGKGSFQANVRRGDLSNIAIESKELESFNFKWGVDDWNTMSKKLKQNNITELELFTVGEFIKTYELKPLNSNKMSDGGEMDVRIEDTVQRMDNPNFADISFYKKGGELQGLTQSEIDTNVHKIATKFKLPLEYINSQLKLGIKFEMEHTNDKSIASKIALDHLNESPYYYQKLSEMEKELDTMKMDADTYLPKIISAYANGGEVDMIFKLNTPTKQPTKLNYIQQVLVRTTEFKKWFGDWEKCAKSFLQDDKSNFLQHYKNCSIVIDLTTLEPQVVYHGTNFKEEFYTFDVTKKEGVGRPYGYFADNIEYSQNFTTNSQRGQHGLELLYKCFLNIRNPFMAITEDFYDELDNQIGWGMKISKVIAKKNYGENITDEQWAETLKVVLEQIGTYIYATFGFDDKPFWLLMARDTKKEFKYFLMSHGFDGVRYAEEFKGVYDVDNPAEFTKAWTIFDANQVKLADGRNIDFDPFKEDIRYEDGGSLTELNQEDMQQENMSKAQMLRNTIGVNKFAEGGTVKGDGKHTNDAKKGGFFDGRSHADGGIKAVNKDTGQMLEVEGNEVIINKRSVADNTKREFEGKMMTNREILSTINEMGGGVSFKEGGEINQKSCKCMGKKYKFGGNLISDFDIVKELTTSYNDVIKKPISNSINYVENLINKINGKF